MGRLYRLPMTTFLAPEWATAIQTWSVALRAVGREETTIGTRREHLRWLATWARERSPWDLTEEDLTDWMGHHVWSLETRRGVRASVRVFYAWALRTGRVQVDPAAALPIVKAAIPDPRPAPIRVYRQALAEAPYRERLILRLAAECGMRRAEVAQIHRDDLVEDLEGWSIQVHGKGRRNRTVPLPPDLARELRRVCENSGGYAFPGSDHGHLSPRWVGKMMARRLEGDWTMHTLRHLFATTTYAIDRDVFTVQDLLGHASPATTRRYVKLPDDSKRKHVMAAVARLEGAA